MTVYLDHAATSPVLPEVVRAMEAVGFGNPSGAHHVGRAAAQSLDEAREVVAAACGAEPGGVIFTSGGTEADNLACHGRGGPAIISAIEHAAVLGPCAGAVRVPVNQHGVVDVEQLEALLTRETTFVAVMTANNEVGTLQPIGEIAERIRLHSPGAVFHTDAVQAAPWCDLTAVTDGADTIALSAHKLGGPKGIGALVIRGATSVSPMMLGGGQERDRRSGTQWVAGAVGLAAALTAARTARPDATGVAKLRDRLADGLVAEGAVESAPRDLVLPGHCHVRFPGVEQEELLVLLDDAGVCASAGSSCASGALEPSHVLAAMGLPDARSVIRFSLGHATTEADIETALDAVRGALRRLR